MALAKFGVALKEKFPELDPEISAFMAEYMEKEQREFQEPDRGSISAACAEPSGPCGHKQTTERKLMVTNHKVQKSKDQK